MYTLQISEKLHMLEKSYLINHNHVLVIVKFFSVEYVPKHARRVLMELFKCFQNLSCNWIVQDKVICNAVKSI